MSDLNEDADKTIRARIRNRNGRWRTTHVRAFQFVSRTSSRIPGKMDYRNYITIGASGGMELQFKWSEIEELHSLLGAVMDESTAERAKLIQADKEAEQNMP